MDNARILCGSLDIAKIEPSQKDNAIRQFLDLIQCFRTHKVTMHKEEGFTTFQYPDDYTADILYSSWEQIKTHPAFNGLSQKTFQLIAVSLNDRPRLGKEISISDWEKKTATGFNCDFGLDIFHPSSDGYIVDSESWHINRCGYYQLHQEEIPWDICDNEFLPNRLYSDKLIADEIQRHKEDPKYNINVQDKLHVKFHNGIVRHKGTELHAYIEQIGDKICLANFYKLEHSLSKEEKQRTNSPRKIYSLINRTGDRQFISLDFAHGMFEYIDANGNHLGEFRFTGHKNSDPETNHGFPKGFKKFI